MATKNKGRNKIGLKVGSYYKMYYGNLDILLKFSFFYGEAAKFRIVDTRNSCEDQAIYLPFKNILPIAEDRLVSQDWFWRKPGNRHKLVLSGYVDPLFAK